MTMDLVVIATEIHQRKMNHLDLAEIQVLIIKTILIVRIT